MARIGLKAGQRNAFSNVFTSLLFLFDLICIHLIQLQHVVVVSVWG